MHIPGPWRIFKQNNHFIMASDCRGGIIATCHRHSGEGKEPEQMDANAHLIAAAPMLLEASVKAQKIICEEWCGKDDHCDDCIELQRAIAAAREEE